MEGHTMSAAQTLYQHALRLLSHGACWPALEKLAQSYRLHRGLPWSEAPDLALWPQATQWPCPSRVSHPKLKHDLEQLDYLLASGDLPAEPFAAGREAFAAACRALLPLAEAQPLPLELAQALQGWLGRNWFCEPLRLQEPILNPELDYASLEALYLKQAPGFTAMDQVLSAANRQALWTFFQKASIFHDYWRGAYVGSYLEDGCHGPWLGQLAQALQQAFPRTLGRYPLSVCWAYKYDSEHPGIGPHADAQAQIIWSLWLTPDEANLQPGRSGLNIYALSVPPDFSGHQTATPEFQEQLSQTPFVQIPYACNRAVMFYGGLLHSSDQLFFRPDYLSRRLNLTLVFGLRPYESEQQAGVTLARQILPVCQ